MAPADAPASDVAFVVDVVVTWIGAAALSRYVFVMGERGLGSSLERRARLLVGALAALLFVRGFSWLTPDSVGLAFLTFLPVTLLPIGMTIFTEGLLRRHVPRSMKIIAAASTAVGFTANFVRLFIHSSRIPAIIGAVVLTALLVTLMGLGIVALRRDVTSLSRAENALVRVCTTVAAVALPLAVTDFRFDIGWPMVRLGTLGALLFCYALLRQPQENVRVSRWLGDVARLVGRAVVFGALIAVALQSTSGATIVPIFVLAIAIVLAFAVFDRLRELERTTPQMALLRWLARERPPSLQQWVRELRALPLTADAELLDQAALVDHDRSTLLQAFTGPTPVQSLARLRAMREEGRGASRGADELSDILERHGATHVGLVTSTPMRLLIVTVPELPGLREVELALAAVIRRGQQIPEPEPSPVV